MKLKIFYEKIYEKIFSIPFFKMFLKIPGVEKLLQYEIVSYLVFGVLTTVVNFATYLIAGTVAGEGYEEKNLFTLKLFGSEFDISLLILINAIAWIVSVLFAFVTNKLFVFESSSWKSSIVTKELVSFIGARILSFIIFEELIFMLLINIFGIHHLISKLLVAVFVVIFNFVASKLVIFRKKDSKNSEEQEDKNA